MPFVELHCRSAFSFLQGASLPEEIAARAAELEMPALALADADGVHAAPRLFRAAQKAGLRPIVGSEISMEDGSRLPLLVENRSGYRNLCRLITRMNLRAPKGEGRVCWSELPAYASGLVALTGDDSGPLAFALRRGADDFSAPRLLQYLRNTFGADNVFVELNRHLQRNQRDWQRSAVELAERFHLPLLASNAPRYVQPAARALLDVFTCLREHTRLELAGRLLAANSERYLKSEREMCELFFDQRAAVERSGELAERLRFTLHDLGYEFPLATAPPGETMASWLRRLVLAGAEERYRPQRERSLDFWRRVETQLERELRLIEKLRLEGYFLIVWDIVRYCREHDILAQGRGSAANSAVCYSLGITAVDPIGMELLFERFLSEERGEWPDIDIDLPSGERREQVIQYVYQRYGYQRSAESSGSGAAMTANVITYRARSAAREVGKVLGFPDAMVARLAQSAGILAWGGAGAERSEEMLRQSGVDPRHPRIRQFLQLCVRMQDLPRHLGQHSGGMVLCQGPLDEIVPLENASMPGRVVVQWDKDDCAALGLIKVDLLGLGMMAALQDSIRLVERHGAAVARCGSAARSFDLAHLPPDDPDVYRMLCEADSIGVFQVESRAQMATLPRLRPQRFYDLVIQVALIRPGPIVGNMVHPYLRRRNGKEPVRYAHPALEPILRRTLGVPLFQEQLLRMAMVMAGFSGGEAEELRRALGFKRAEAAMSEVELKLRRGMAQQGIEGAVAEEVIDAITSFALYGFPESHSASFALLVYASAYLKEHFPAVFYTALLNNQPMGFYHPATLVKDAQRHGVRVLPVSVQESDWDCRVLPAKAGEAAAIRLGLRYTAGLRAGIGQQLQRERERGGGFRSLEDLRRRSQLNQTEITTLGEIGALNCFSGSDGTALRRREALWQVQRAWRGAGPLWEQECAEGGGEFAPERSSPLRDMSLEERVVADFRGTGLTVGPHPMALRRGELSRLGIRTAAQLRHLPNNSKVEVAGVVIARQRPATAQGLLFLSLEDETGISNIIVPQPVLDRFQMLLVAAPQLCIRGTVQSAEGVVNVRAGQVRALPGAVDEVLEVSHDFH